MVEQAVLGGLMLDNAPYGDVAKIVGSDDFLDEGHKLIFQAIGELVAAKRPADQLTVAEWLDREDAAVLESVGGHQYLASLSLNTPSAANVRRYAESVRERALERRRGAAAAKTKRKVQRAVDWQEFFARFTLIYPTDTCWDAVLGRIVKVSAMKIAFGEGTVKFWQESPERRTVNADQVVFDPSGQPSSECVNLFRGMPKWPASGGTCDKLLELLQYLCGEAQQDQAPITDWVLRWIAYALQHPGAKMQTAIVMHGPEGAGKNLFWGAVRDMYGEYGSLITQAEIESPYNAWLSQRLFLIANEVVSRQELRHHVGRLKNLITEPELPISEKYMPLRYEANHVNIAFLTNELQAMLLGPDDRRNMVIRTPREALPDFYRDVAAELAGGGVGAFHRYLMDFECGDFGAHTKPLRTAAKDDLIELGLSSTQGFQRQLHDGLLHPLPYGPCLATDLFRAYSVFCMRTGEKNPARLTRFSHEFMSMNGVSRRVMDVTDPDRPIKDALDPRRRQRTVFIMGACAEGLDEGIWVKKNVSAFRDALREFLQADRLDRDAESGGDPGGASYGYRTRY